MRSGHLANIPRRSRLPKALVNILLGQLMPRALFTGKPTRRDVNRLSDQEIRRAKTRGDLYRLNDGGNLYVLVYPSGKKSFEFRYTRDGKRQAVILGNYGSSSGQVGLKAVRAERDRQRALLASGQDPATQRKLVAEEERTALAAATVVSREVV